LAYTLSGGRRTNKQTGSYEGAQRQFSPTERTTSASLKAEDTLADTELQQHDSLSNKIPLPHLEKPVYHVHYDDQPLDDEMTMEAV